MAINPIPNNVECERIITSKDVGVLVMCREREPYAVPMNFAFTNGKLYFHCGLTGRKLDMLRSNPQVCFVVERSVEKVPPERRMCHPDWESVIAYGAARVVEDPKELREAFIIFGRNYRPDFVFKESSLENTRAIVMEISSMTARSEVNEQVQYWSWSPASR